MTVPLRMPLLRTAALLAIAPALAAAEDSEPAKKTRAPSSIHDFTVKDIDGKDIALAKFRDQVLLVVNVASQ